MTKSQSKNKSLIIIQARVSSKRLPGKVLLPIEGIPSIILSVKRATNTGKDIIVATSNHRSDDKLVKLLKREKIKYFRGNLNNVLSRFASIVKNLDPDKPIFRLTADNVLPDGKILDEMEKEFIKKKIQYLQCGKNSGLPYGVSAELTKAKYLTEANLKSKTKYEKEHVTPYIKKKYKIHYFLKNKNYQMEKHRCTIDTINDYKLIKKVFKNLGSQSININYKVLVNRIKKLSSIN